jgi:hypothetical protein
MLLILTLKFPLNYLRITFELSGRARGAVGANAETGAGELSAVALCYVFILFISLPLRIATSLISINLK